MSEGEPLFARCARSQTTCCQKREIYVTPGDAQRIAAHTGRTDFCEFRVAEDPNYLDQDDDPTWRDCVFRSDGSRRVMNQRESGDCTFLGPLGCTLPLEVRPLLCRLYPFDFDETGIKDELVPGCPVHLVGSGLTVLDELQMDRGAAQKWQQQLYQEIRLEEHAP
jgi:Fe-S-cluster containining protein